MKIELKNINKSFFVKDKESAILRDINLLLEPGKITALVGPSGSGKTTLLQIAGLLDSPTSGQVMFDNQNLSNSKDKERTEFRKNNIGFIYQDHNLLPEFNAIENILLPLLIKKENKKTSFKKAEEILEKINLSDKKNSFPYELSGGEQQRIAIARAIITKPKILFADEPTGNLDSKNAENIFQIFYNFTKEYQINSLIVTHNMDLAKQMDQIITIEDGKITN
jgi:lipoprotein-releasing system ATP-binding protein|tara:strand:- start:795 stop:1463 length:669 start_codon:yes stop_codon:yes gene_type:complete